MSQNDSESDLEGFIDNTVVYGGDIAPADIVESCTYVDGRRRSTRQSRKVERYVDDNYARLMFDDACEEDVFMSDDDSRNDNDEDQDDEETFFYNEEQDDTFVPEVMEDELEDEDTLESDMAMTNELEDSEEDEGGMESKEEGGDSTTNDQRIRASNEVRSSDATEAKRKKVNGHTKRMPCVEGHQSDVSHQPLSDDTESTPESSIGSE